MNTSPSQRTVLVIEDERPLLNIIHTKLEANGFDVVTARTVEQAIHFLSDLPQITGIWLDHYLLGAADGVEFVSHLKREEKWKDIPVFVVSNTAHAATQEAYKRLGVAGYYAKADYRLDQIISDIESFLASWRPQNQLQMGV